jgi:hypothetical protein
MQTGQVIKTGIAASIQPEHEIAADRIQLPHTQYSASGEDRFFRT